MQIKQLFKEDDAVSPVIGVILMVAITVILAAVIASFVLGLGDTADEVQPTSSLSFDYDEADGNLTVKIADGDSITAENLWLRGSVNDTENYGSDDGSVDIDVNFETLVNDDMDQLYLNSSGVSGFTSSSDEISAGQGIELSATNSSSVGGSSPIATESDLRSYELDIVWDTGDDSATLDSDSREK